MRWPVFGSLALCWLTCMVLAAHGAGVEVPNGDFSAGNDGPDGWKLSGGRGRWVDRTWLEVSGEGHDANQWQAVCRFEPGGLYRFEMRARAVEGTGSAIAGPGFANHDWQLTPEWQDYGFVFRAPDGVRQSEVRLGQWQAKGTFQFDRVRIVPVVPAHRRVGDVSLGEGETIRRGRYQFVGSFAGAGGGYHRPLHSATATFNTDRWCLYRGSELVYRFAVADQTLNDPQLSVNVNYHAAGTCLVEVSRDGNDWKTVATVDRVGTAVATLPSEWSPAEVLFVRLRGSRDSVVQVNRVEFSATLSPLTPGPSPASGRGEVGTSAPVDVIGRTIFASLTGPSDELVIDRMTLLDRDGPPRVLVEAHQTGTGDLGTELTAAATSPDGKTAALPTSFAQLDAGRPAGFMLELPSARPGTTLVEATLSAPGLAPLRFTLPIEVADLYRADYGERIAAASGESADVWWCDATHKIARQRATPQQAGPAAAMSAARNDREAVQIVVRPRRALKNLSAAAGPLVGPGGATIAAQRISILRVAYHFVHQPTDKTGVIDWWPDALPPLQTIDVAADQNQPLWVLVHVPHDAAAGDYQGTVDLKADGWAAQVPLRLHVWNFALPDRNHIETAFGLTPHTVYRYHQLKTEEDKRRVLDMYHESFAAHRISPYDPAPLDPIRVKFLPDADPPRAEVDFSRFDAAAQRAFERFHFSNFMLPLQGMGGGSFHHRVDPAIGKYGADTPQYQGAFASYVTQLEQHLRDKGWLGREYIYWFDEPDPKDYEFVRAGMERIKRYAPNLTTMLTEEPNEKLAGPIDIWCPVSFNYNHEEASRRRAAGQRIWWYVCCGPKAPHCTLFIDHPATELRVWLWQTWQRDIAGILVWSANYWHSDTAFPDTVQNPYDDPMGYVTGYGVPKGTKQYWGNGDGRFVYPPEAAAAPGRSGAGAVIAPPVSSIRWEMLREGIEDWEYLYLLRELVEKRGAPGGGDAGGGDANRRLLEVPPSITSDMTTFTTDPAPIYARRKAIAEAIEREMGR